VLFTFVAGAHARQLHPSFIVLFMFVTRAHAQQLHAPLVHCVVHIYLQLGLVLKTRRTCYVEDVFNANRPL